MQVMYFVGREVIQPKGEYDGHNPLPRHLLIYHMNVARGALLQVRISKQVYEDTFPHRPVGKF
jgi:hypothetical protein